MPRLLNLAACLFFVTAPLGAFAADSSPVQDAKPAAAPVDPGAKSATLAAKPDDVVIGKAEAPVTIVEYSSLSCPHCAHFHKEILPQIEKNYLDTGKAKLLVRPFPLNKPAFDGAKLIACLPPERAPKFVDVLFKMQDQWAYSVDDIDALQKLAAVGGVSEGEFKTCMASEDNEKKILKSRDDAQKILGVESTPTFFVGDRKIEGAQDVKTFSDAIEGKAGSAVPPSK